MFARKINKKGFKYKRSQKSDNVMRNIVLRTTSIYDVFQNIEPNFNVDPAR